MHRTLTENETASLTALNGSGGSHDEPWKDAPVAEPDGRIHRFSPGAVKIYQDRVRIRTTGEFDVIDITAEVQASIQRCGVKEGYALVFSPHTTCALLLNEKESGLLSDIGATLSRLVPERQGYLHDDFDVRTENMSESETKNAHAHIRQVLAARTSEYIPVSKGALLLGKWQRVMFVEFDRSRDREAFIQVFGV